MKCLEFQEFLEKCLDEGAPQDLPAWKEHLATCAPCRQSFQTVQRFLEIVAGFPVPLPPQDLEARIVFRVVKDFRARRRRFRQLVGLAALAASLLLVALSRVLEWTRPVSPPPEQEIAQKIAEKVPPQPPSVGQKVNEARQAVTALTERLADKGKEQAKMLWLASNPFDGSPPVPMPPAGELEAPLDPAVHSLRDTTQGLSEGFQTVALGARRALTYFIRELPPLERGLKNKESRLN